jgi:hypothetical protein
MPRNFISLRKEIDEASLAVDLSFVEEGWTDKVNLISIIFGANGARFL